MSLLHMVASDPLLALFGLASSKSFPSAKLFLPSAHSRYDPFFSGKIAYSPPVTCLLLDYPYLIVMGVVSSAELSFRATSPAACLGQIRCLQVARTSCCNYGSFHFTKTQPAMTFRDTGIEIWQVLKSKHPCCLHDAADEVKRDWRWLYLLLRMIGRLATVQA